MTHKDIIMKLIGPINPVGCSSRDPERLANLKDLCELVDQLVGEIDDVSYKNKDAHEHSIKEAQKFAETFLTNKLGIKE